VARQVCKRVLPNGTSTNTVARTTCEGLRMTYPTQQQVNDYLNVLRISGITNMFGAVPYIQENFGITKYDANRFLVKWMETFNTEEKIEND